MFRPRAVPEPDHNTASRKMSMQRKIILAGVGAALFSLAAAGNSSAQQAGPQLPPLSSKVWKTLHSDPQAWQQFLAEHAPVRPAPILPGAPWMLAFTTMALSNPLLLTDGTVLAHAQCTPNWYRLTPDIHGNYKNGSWTAAAPMPAGYSPRFFGSQILPDGRVLVEGGEDNGPMNANGFCKRAETTDGAIYDPVADSWISVPPPPGLTQIGDASLMVLANGTVLLAPWDTTDQAILDPATLTWTITGTGKQDPNNEENWTLLPDGNVLTVDADFDLPASECIANSEVYSTATGSWTSAGSTINELSSCSGSVYAVIDGVNIYTGEAPTQIMSPWGDVYAFGATVSTASENFPVPMSIYKTATGTWISGPNLPQVEGINYTMADAPAAMLPDGRVLIAASPGVWENYASYPAPTHFFIYDGKKAHEHGAYEQASDTTDAAQMSPYEQVGDMTDAAVMPSFRVNFLVLPTGEVLATETDYTNTDIFPAVCCADPAWAPRIMSISSYSLVAGGTYTLQGRQLSGLTQGAGYGEDAQADTNFPLVRITNRASQHVFYGRTYGFSRSIASGAVSSTRFDVPNGIESGASSLVVVANGIASRPINVTVQ